MTDQKKWTSNLDTLQAMQASEASASDRATKALRELSNVPGAVKSAQDWLAENSAVTQAQRWLQQNSLSASFEAAELRRMDELKGLLDPYQDIQKLLRPDAGIQAALDIARQHENLTTKLNIEVQAAQAFSRHLDSFRNIAKQFEASFRLPPKLEVARLLADAQLGTGAVAAFARQHMSDFASQRDLVASMSSPWLRELEAARSATALMELHGLGAALRSVQGFDEQLTAVLRSDLGDWRDRITFPQAVFNEPVTRTAFYVERGFNLSLTDFPEATFQEGLIRSGLNDETDEATAWPEIAEAMDAVEEAAFRRTNKCHNHLQRLERRLRQFIDQAMTAQYGANWPKKRLAPQMLESWEHKKLRAEDSGVILTMFIEVADFTDYEAIICRKDHWREVFQSRFKRPESVRESFQRLYPIRLATMHARFVTKEDELYVLAESMRLLGALSG
jgi:hypothetical protein